ncbi:MAG: SCO family protein [Magnetococcales bacterium]|nr:SCO family protein [Magnetococcales bacterium]
MPWLDSSPFWRRRSVVPTLLLGWLCVFPAWAEAPVGKGRDPVFESRVALETSQAALGRTLEAYTLTDPEGKKVELSSFLGKPLVISLIYTSCYHTCSVSTRFLASVVDKARETFGAQSFQVVSIGFDTRYDTPKAMAAFARQQGIAAQPDWSFLSASPETMVRLTHQLGFVFAPSPKGFDHLVQATIVDAKGVVYRQVYGESFQTQLLTEPLRTLILGTPPTEAETPVDELVRRVRFFCTTYDPNTDSYRFDYSLFIGLFCGGSVILGTFFFLLREWWYARKKRRD